MGIKLPYNPIILCTMRHPIRIFQTMALGLLLLVGAIGGAFAQGKPFITKWRTSAANEELRIPFFGQKFTVTWYTPGGEKTTATVDDSNINMPYTLKVPTAGEVIIEAGPEGLTGIMMGNNGSPAVGASNKALIAITQWGDVEWQQLTSAFSSCDQLAELPAGEAPKLANAKSLDYLFANCTMLNSPVEHWDVSAISSMMGTFSMCRTFNQPLEKWDVSQVSNMQSILEGCSAFNQPLGKWALKNVKQVGLSYCGMSRRNYDASIEGWAAQKDLAKNVQIVAKNLTYTCESAGRNMLIQTGWQFEADIQACFKVNGPGHMTVGETKNVSAEFEGNVAPDERNVEWSSENAEFATVDAQGAVKALKSGLATIKGTWEGRVRTSQIKIASVVTSVEVHPQNITIKMGQVDLKLFATVLPEDAEDKTLTWAVEPSDLAETDGTSIKTKRPGVGKIIATAKNGVKGEAVLTILENTAPIVPVVAINMQGNVREMQVGDAPTQIKAEVMPQDATNKILKWRVEPEGAGIIDENGLLTVLKAGKLQVIAEAHNGIQGAIDVHVEKAGTHPSVKSIKVFPARLVVDKGAMGIQLTTVIEPKEMASTSLNWRVEPKEIAYVMDGRLTAQAPGRARVIATALNGVTGECEVIVREAATLTNVTLKVLPEQLEMRKDATPVQLHAELLPVDLADQTITWFVKSGNSATVSATGLVTPGAELGETVIGAVGYNGVLATCTVKVVEDATLAKPVTAVTMKPNTLLIRMGAAAADLEATVTPNDATKTDLTYKVVPEGIVTVADGKVTPVKAGRATVYAIAHNGVMGVCEVTVLEAAAPEVAVSDVKIIPATLAMKMGDAPVQLTAKVEPADASNRAIQWSVEPAELASVDQNGVVTPLKEGKGHVIAKANGGKEAKCELSIEEASAATVPVKSVTLDPAVLMLTMGGQASKLTATVLPSDATVNTVTWRVEPEGIASVDNEGQVTPVKSGTAWVIATANNGVQGKCRVNVLAQADPEYQVESVVVAPATLNIKMGDSPAQLRASVMPENAVQKDVTWTVDPADVVKVENGLITPLKVGLATVTAATKNGKKGICVVNVLEESSPIKSVTGVTVTPESIEMRMGDAPKQLEGKVQPDDATNQALTWSSEPKGFVSVDSRGRIVALAVGTAKVIATSHNGIQAMCTVTVKDALPTVEVKSVTLMPAKLSMKMGDAPAQLTAQVMPAEATDKTIVWSADPSDVVKVEDGLVTPLKAGNAKVFATASNGVKGECEVTILEASSPEISVASVGIKPASLMMQIGDEPKQLEVNILPVDATNKDVTWRVEPEGIVTLDNGKVTPVKAGKATVIATAHNGVMGTCEVTVVDAPAPAVPVTSVTVNPSSFGLVVGMPPAPLTVTVLPENATDKSVSWSATPEGIVVVDAKGVVTALKAGQATVTATARNGVSGSCQITVTAPNTPGQKTAVEALRGVVVSPNPFDAQFTVHHAAQVVRYELVNASGLVVLSGRGTGETLHIATAHLPHGVYVLRLHAVDGSHSIMLVK